MRSGPEHQLGDLRRGGPVAVGTGAMRPGCVPGNQDQPVTFAYAPPAGHAVAGGDPG
jgi:hypothetical protein